MSTPYHASCNGIVENCNKTIKNLLIVVTLIVLNTSDIVNNIILQAGVQVTVIRSTNCEHLLPTRQYNRQEAWRGKLRSEIFCNDSCEIKYCS